MATAYIKQGDTGRSIDDALLFDGEALNLTGATVVLRMQNLQTGEVTLVDAEIVSALGGTVSATLGADDVATCGDYRIEWGVTLPDDTILTVPDNTYHILKIVAKIPES